LRETAVTDSGLMHVAKLSELRYLFLDRSDVTDKGLTHLVWMKRLHTVGLYETPVTDTGLAILSLREQMWRLEVVNCPQVTQDGVDGFRKAQPKVEVVASPMPLPARGERPRFLSNLIGKWEVVAIYKEEEAKNFITPNWPITAANLPTHKVEVVFRDPQQGKPSELRITKQKDTTTYSFDLQFPKQDCDIAWLGATERSWRGKPRYGDVWGGRPGTLRLQLAPNTALGDPFNGDIMVLRQVKE
jgi:hypothetical protein